MNLLKRFAFVSAITISVLSSSSAFSQALTKASVRLDWVPGADHVFMYYGKEKGFFAAEGIDLEIVPGQGSPLSIKLVGNQNNDFGFADASTVARGWEAGVPIYVLHVLWQETPVMLLTRKSSGITKLQDICGKKVGVHISSTTYTTMKAMLKAANVTCSFEEIPTASGGLTEYVNGSVDAIHGFTHMFPVFAKQRGVEGTEFPASDYFKNLYAMSLITSTAVLEKGDLAQRFTRAALKSLDETLKNPDEAMAAFARANKEVNPDDTKAQFPVLARLFTVDRDGQRVIGHQTLAGWTNTIDVLMKSGVLKERVDPKGRFLEAADR